MGAWRNIRARHLLIIAYGVLVAFVVVGFMRLEHLAERLELEAAQRAHVNCMAINETAETVLLFTTILRTFAAEQGETEEEAAARDQFVEDIKENIMVTECPPPPEPGQPVPPPEVPRE